LNGSDFRQSLSIALNVPFGERVGTDHEHGFRFRAFQVCMAATPALALTALAYQGGGNRMGQGFSGILIFGLKSPLSPSQ
jgi:hypothetical protein